MIRDDIRSTFVRRHSPWRPAIAAWLLLAFSGMSAQTPVDPAIARAAARMASISTPTMPLQTIPIGAFDNATHRWTWRLAEYYPDSVPLYKRADHGGPMQPMHRANILSYNVRYQVAIAHPSADLKLTLSVPDGHDTLRVAATIDASGNAFLAFNPYSNAVQQLRISYNGGASAVAIWPVLHAQLGAFVVPHMLISIVYEPPGAYSKATYGAGSTEGSTISWGFARTHGLVSATGGGSMQDILEKGGNGVIQQGGDQAKAAAESIAVAKAESTTAQVLGTVVPIVMTAAFDILTDMMKAPTVTVTTTAKVDTTHSEGWHISLAETFGTALHAYPGRGDRFIVMDNVLFVYMVKDGHVMLAPMAYTQPIRGLTLTEMQQQLPSALVQNYASLDPLIVGISARDTMAVAALPSEAGRPAALGPLGRVRAAAPRFTAMTQILECKASGTNGLDLAVDDWQSTAVAAETTQTTVTQPSGLVNSMLAGNEPNLWGMTYHSSHEDISGDRTDTDIEVACAPNDEFEVRVFYDNIFRTFMAVRGEALGPVPRLQGRIADRKGVGLARQRVLLRVGGLTYVVRADRNGDFAFRSSSIPIGKGTLVAGSLQRTVVLGREPVPALKLTIP